MVSSSENEEILKGLSAELRESLLQLLLFPLNTGSRRCRRRNGVIYKRRLL